MDTFALTFLLLLLITLQSQVVNGFTIKKLVSLSLVIFNLPTTHLEKFNQRVSQRKREGLKRCECCHCLVKQSDFMCRHCKLEISLGRQLK